MEQPLMLNMIRSRSSQELATGMGSVDQPPEPSIPSETGNRMIEQPDD